MAHCCTLNCGCKEKGKANLLLHTIFGKFDGARRSGTLSMPPDVWGEFPEELIERALLKLPVISLSRMRTIDKKWHSILTSRSFLTRLSAAIQMGGRRPAPPESPLPICAYAYIHETASANHALLQSLQSNYIDVHQPKSKDEAKFVRETAQSWHMKRPAQVAKCDLSFFPQKLLPYNAENARMRLSDDGLLVTLLGEDRGLYLINPMTRTWRELPVYKHPSGNIFFDTPVAMVDEECPTDYRVVALKSAYITDHSEQNRPWSVAVFSSKTGAWTVNACEHHRALNVLEGWMRTVGNDGKIYSQNQEGLLLIHDLQGRLVVEATPGFPRPAVAFSCGHHLEMVERLCLMEYKGDLFTAVKFKAVRSEYRVLGISKLDRSRYVWGAIEYLIPSKPSPSPGNSSLINQWRLSHNWTGRVGLAGDFIWVVVMYQHPRTLENLHRIDALHIPSMTWVTLDTEFQYPFTKDFRLFQPKALHVLL